MRTDILRHADVCYHHFRVLHHDFRTTTTLQSYWTLVSLTWYLPGARVLDFQQSVRAYSPQATLTRLEHTCVNTAGTVTCVPSPTVSSGTTPEDNVLMRGSGFTQLANIILGTVPATQSTRCWYRLVTYCCVRQYPPLACTVYSSGRVQSPTPLLQSHGDLRSNNLLLTLSNLHSTVYLHGRYLQVLHQTLPCCTGSKLIHTITTSTTDVTTVT